MLQLAKLILQIYFTWNVKGKDQLLKAAILFAFITSLYYFFLLYLGNLLFLHVLLLIAIDFASMFVYLWILVQHQGIAYWAFVIIGLAFFHRSTLFLMDRFVSF